VQGVGYRAFLHHWAMRLQVSGWARNRRDGSVEAFLCGAAADVEALLDRMRQGPPSSFVADLRFVEPAETLSREGFELRPTL